MIFTSSEYFTMIIAIWCGEVVVGASDRAVGAPLVFQIVFIYFWRASLQNSTEGPAERRTCRDVGAQVMKQKE